MTVLQWGIVAALFVMLAGRLLSPRIAVFLVAEPTAQRRMRRNAIVGVSAASGLVVLATVAVWFVLAAFASDEGCAWIVGIGGCLP